jgi:hypothetical protein
MTESWAVASAYREYLDALREVDVRWAERGVTDEQTVLDGYRWAVSLASVAADVFVWADTDRPRFVDIVGPYKKFNGDNTDAYYQFAPIDPNRTYIVRGTCGDAVYFSLTVYGTSLDTTEDRVVHTDRIVAIVNDLDLDCGPGDAFELALGPSRPDGWDGLFVELPPEAVCAITRDYLRDAREERRVEWAIEALDPPSSVRDHDEALAARFRAAARWVRSHVEAFPTRAAAVNTVGEPYPVPARTSGWAAGDAAYAMGAYELADDEALVVRGRSPECRFWNLCLWTPFLTTYNYEYDEPVSIHGHRIRYEADGSWTIVIAATDPGHPNWVSTAGHRTGRLWFRWFYPSATPSQPVCEVVPLAAAPTSV